MAEPQKPPSKKDVQDRLSSGKRTPDEEIPKIEATAVSSQNGVNGQNGINEQNGINGQDNCGNVQTSGQIQNNDNLHGGLQEQTNGDTMIGIDIGQGIDRNMHQNGIMDMGQPQTMDLAIDAQMNMVQPQISMNGGGIAQGYQVTPSEQNMVSGMAEAGQQLDHSKNGDLQ